jgi:signal transduction histidine kinase
MNEEEIRKFLDQCSDETIERMKDEMSHRLSESASYSNHLSNVISGINHEVAPWIGGALNSLSRLQGSLNEDTDIEYIKNKIETTLDFIQHGIEIMSTISSNVKQLKEHSNSVCSVYSTVDSWVRVTLLDRYVKSMIHENNIYVDKESLDFEASHSPMYLAQIIFNLAKNTIDHNQHMLDDLRIKIYGDKENSCLIYEDNGKGIPEDVRKRIFRAGFTTKPGEVHQHGLGLSSCLDYTIIMEATIVCESVPGCTRFILKFNDSYERLKSDEWDGIKEAYNESMKYQNGTESGGYAAVRRVPCVREKRKD